jgi:hypothetical protein
MLYNEKDKLLAFNVHLTDLIKSSKLKEAIDYAITMIDKNSIIHNQLIRVSASLEKINQQDRKNILHKADFNIEISKITDDLIEIAEDVKDHDLAADFNFQEINNIRKAISIIKSINQERRELEENLIGVNDILNKERSDYQSMVNQIEEKNNTLKEESFNQQKALDSHLERINKLSISINRLSFLEEENAIIKMQLLSHLKEISTLEENCKNLVQLKEESNSKELNFMSELLSNKAIITQLEISNKMLLTKIEEIETELLKSKKEESLIRTANTEANDQILSFKTNFNELQLLNDSLLAEIEEKKRIIIKYEEERTSNMKTQNELNHNYKKLKQEYLKANEERQSLKIDIEISGKHDLLVEIKELYRKNIELNDLLNDSIMYKRNIIVEEEKKKLDKVIEAQNKKNERLNEKIADLKEELSTYKKEIKNLKMAYSGNTSYLLKSDLEKLKDYFFRHHDYYEKRELLCPSCFGRKKDVKEMPLYFFSIIWKKDCKDCKGLGTNPKHNYGDKIR